MDPRKHVVRLHMSNPTYTRHCIRVGPATYPINLIWVRWSWSSLIGLSVSVCYTSLSHLKHRRQTFLKEGKRCFSVTQLFVNEWQPWTLTTDSKLSSTSTKQDDMSITKRTREIKGHANMNNYGWELRRVSRCLQKKITNLTYYIHQLIIMVRWIQ